MEVIIKVQLSVLLMSSYQTHRINIESDVLANICWEKSNRDHTHRNNISMKQLLLVRKYLSAPHLPLNCSLRANPGPIWETLPLLKRKVFKVFSSGFFFPQPAERKQRSTLVLQKLTRGHNDSPLWIFFRSIQVREASWYLVLLKSVESLQVDCWTLLSRERTADVIVFICHW